MYAGRCTNRHGSTLDRSTDRIETLIASVYRRCERPLEWSAGIDRMTSIASAPSTFRTMLSISQIALLTIC